LAARVRAQRILSGNSRSPEAKAYYLSFGVAEAIWGADVQPAAPARIWEAFQWNSASQMKYLRAYALLIGRRFQDLVPDTLLPI